jgi:ABC-type sugar transport system substrate-binding protein
MRMIKARGILIAIAMLAAIFVLQRIKSQAREDTGELFLSPVGVQRPRPKQLRIAVVGDDPAQEKRLRAEIALVEGAVPNLHVKLCMPLAKTAAAQRAVIRGLLLEALDGIVVSPVDPDGETALLNEAGRSTLLFTINRDAPGSNRQGHAGEDPIRTGELFASELRAATSSPGKVFVFADNVNDRETMAKISRIRESLDGSKFILSDVLSDAGEGIVTKANVARVLARESKIAAFIGLSSDTSPMIVDGLRKAGKLGQVTVLCSGSAEATLAAVKSGAAFCTVDVDPRHSGGVLRTQNGDSIPNDTPLGSHVQIALHDMYKRLTGDKSSFTSWSGRHTRATSFRRDSIDEYAKFVAATRNGKPMLIPSRVEIDEQ